MAASGAAAKVQAIKASGVLVRVAPGEFQKLLGRLADPLVVAATGGVFTKNYQYLTSYKGIAFYTKSPEPLRLPASAEVVAAARIWTPN